MRQYKDTETGAIYTEEELRYLYRSYKEDGTTEAETFDDYLSNCLDGSGTLERFDLKAHMSDRISELWEEARHARAFMQSEVHTKQDAIDFIVIAKEASVLLDLLYTLFPCDSFSFEEQEVKEIKCGWKDARELLGV